MEYQGLHFKENIGWGVSSRKLARIKMVISCKLIMQLFDYATVFDHMEFYIC